MKILIDINHPAHVHYFKNLIKILESKGHSFLVISRNKECEHELLENYNIPYKKRGKGVKNIFGKFFYLIKADFLILFHAIKFKPDVFLSFFHPYPAHVAFVLRKPCVVLSDTECAKFHQILTKPFVSKILTPSCFKKDFGKKHVRFNGYMELCYLINKYYQPKNDIYSLLDLKINERYCIIRLVSDGSLHHKKNTGLSNKNILLAIEFFSKFSRVFISSEVKLPVELEKYRLKIPANRMHDVLYYADLLFGESATMSSESAILGTPSIFFDNQGRGYTDEIQQRYSLIFNFNFSPENQNSGINKGLELLSNIMSKNNAKKMSQNLIDDHIDVTAFLINYIENQEYKI